MSKQACSAPSCSPVAQAVRAEQQVFDPDFEPFTGGIAGSLLGYVPGSIFSPVHFGDGSGLRAIDLLNQIALQLRESGWLIIAQPDGSALAVRIHHAAGLDHQRNRQITLIPSNSQIFRFSDS